MKKFTRWLLVSLFAFVLLSTTAMAHETMSEFYPNPDENEGVVEFFFDTYDVMSNVEVTVFDTNGVQIAVGFTDARGLFDFSGFSDVGHLIARYDDEHIHIHVVAEGGTHIVGKSFGGTYIAYDQLGELLRNFVLERWWLSIFVLAIPGAVFAASLVYFIIDRLLRKSKKGGA